MVSTPQLNKTGQFPLPTLSSSLWVGGPTRYNFQHAGVGGLRQLQEEVCRRGNARQEDRGEP